MPACQVSTFLCESQRYRCDVHVTLTEWLIVIVSTPVHKPQQHHTMLRSLRQHIVAEGALRHNVVRYAMLCYASRPGYHLPPPHPCHPPLNTPPPPHPVLLRLQVGMCLC
jgi:hypothetical protein